MSIFISGEHECRARLHQLAAAAGEDGEPQTDPDVANIRLGRFLAHAPSVVTEDMAEDDKICAEFTRMLELDHKDDGRLWHIYDTSQAGMTTSGPLQIVYGGRKKCIAALRKLVEPAPQACPPAPQP